MKKNFDLWIDEPVQEDGFVRYCALLETKNFRYPLWYKIEEQHAPKNVHLGNVFLLAAIFPVMRHNYNLKMHNPVNKRLLTNIMQMQKAWSIWKPKHYQVADILTETDDRPGSTSEDRAICGFTGGVDSSYGV